VYYLQFACSFALVLACYWRFSFCQAL